jgi:arylsulfatase
VRRTRRTTCPGNGPHATRASFDGGWDRLREETLARQIKLGVVPAGTTLTPRRAEIQAWDSMSADQKRLFARQMEVFAGFGEHTDAEVGRLVRAIEDMGQMENTPFIYIVGDNGSSAEGRLEGTFNEMLALNGIVSDASSQLQHADEWGGPNTYPHFAVGWAHAGDTPFQWTKQVASHFGGTRNPVVMHWPRGIPVKAELWSQFHYVIDIAPTVLEATKLPEPTSVNGVTQRPMDGVSMLYAVADAKAPGRRTTQYFEMFGNRAIYHEGVGGGDAALGALGDACPSAGR